jgi:tetratricopeptide (TPR) repeat protein
VNPFLRTAALLAGIFCSPIPSLDAAEPDAASHARLLIEGGRSREAVEFLKKALASPAPDAKSLNLLLARAYMIEGNDFWALRTLAQVPKPDCEAFLWIAWVHIRQGALDEARDALQQAPCDPNSPTNARRLLLTSIVERNARDPGKASEALEQARRSAAAYPEDRAAMALFTRQDPDHIPVLSMRMDLQTGWVSNALTGTPIDPATADQDASSPTANLSLWFRIAPPSSAEHLLRPTLEAQIRGAGYSSEAGRDLSYTLFSFRPAFGFQGRFLRGLLAYRHESSLIASGDLYDEGPLWFYMAHRGEFELEGPGGFLLFGGAGHRKFREIGRSRVEADGGAARRLRLGKRAHLTLAATARRYWAEKDPYHLWGGTLLGSLDIGLARGWSLRPGFSLSLDSYPDSPGYFDLSHADVARQDATIKISTALFIPPPIASLQLGIAYEYAARVSNLDAFHYTDHRLMLKTLWGFSSSPSLPESETPPGHLPLDYGLGSDVLQDRIQDLLRQDESIQRSSSCLD